ncbi:thioredoxin [Candidatus Woesearchaeota archaeon]|nr:thioredoxin [Candidatus Woesearchaeota archaeon]
MVNNIGDKDYKTKTGKGNAVIDFYADWCGPCKIMAPAFEKVGKEVKNIEFFRVNVDDNQEAADAFGIRSIPTIIFLKDGQELDRIIGVMPEAVFKSKVEKAFK